MSTAAEAAALWFGSAPPPALTIDRLHADGFVLRHADNRPAFILGCSAFPMLKFWLEDRPRVERFVDWMVANRMQSARVLGMFNGGLGRFVFQDYGQASYFTAGGTLAAYLNSRGVRLNLDVFADVGAVWPGSTAGDHRQFFDQWADVLRPHAAGIRLGGGNEWEKNQWLPAALIRPAGLFCSRGSGTGDAMPPANPWDTADFHPGRGGRWTKQCKAAYEIQRGNTPTGEARPVPIWFDEPIGVGETDSGNTTANPDLCFDFAAGCKLFTCGLMIHLRSAIIELQPPGPIAQRCVEASVAGAAAVPDDAIEGDYSGGHLGNFPIQHDDAKALRSYGRRVNGRWTVVVLEPSADWRAIPANGFRIVEQRGPRGNVLICE